MAPFPLELGPSSDLLVYLVSRDSLAGQLFEGVSLADHTVRSMGYPDWPTAKLFPIHLMLNKLNQYTWFRHLVIASRDRILATQWPACAKRVKK
jgi:hypothetical protein